MLFIYVCFLFILLNCFTDAYPIDASKSEIDKTNIDCIPPKESHTLLEYNKLEIVNNLNKYPLKDLILQRGIMPEENQIFNQFVHCVWKKNRYVDKNNHFNYDVLENLITGAIVNVVGESGPAINLSILQATKILNEVLNIQGSSPGNKIAKIQNHIVRKLRPFADL